MMKILMTYIFSILTLSQTLRMCYQNKPPPLWSIVSSKLKNNARQWFIGRAEKSGIPWSDLVQKMSDETVFEQLRQEKKHIESTFIEYPEYFLQPFHGYDNGNMEWKAAFEGEAATYSISVNYWKDTHYKDSEKWLRNNATRHIEYFLMNRNRGKYDIKEIVDIGCSIGVSSEHLASTFKTSNILGIDLSPYFLAVANYRNRIKNYRIEYLHRNAEKTYIHTGSKDMVMINFMLHELPFEPRMRVLKEAYRILKPDGILAILDLNPENLQKNLSINQFRKWAFEVTEPHIYSYYQHDMTMSIADAGFATIEEYKNDPINKIWIAEKNMLCVQKEKNVKPTVSVAFAN